MRHKAGFSVSNIIKVLENCVIALDQTLETVVIFHFSGGKVYSLNKGCHTCMIKHIVHVHYYCTFQFILPG